MARSNTAYLVTALILITCQIVASDVIINTKTESHSPAVKYSLRASALSRAIKTTAFTVLNTDVVISFPNVSEPWDNRSIENFELACPDFLSEAKSNPENCEVNITSCVFKYQRVENGRFIGISHFPSSRKLQAQHNDTFNEDDEKSLFALVSIVSEVSPCDSSDALAIKNVVLTGFRNDFRGLIAILFPHPIPDINPASTPHPIPIISTPNPNPITKSRLKPILISIGSIFCGIVVVAGCVAAFIFYKPKKRQPVKEEIKGVSNELPSFTGSSSFDVMAIKPMNNSFTDESKTDSNNSDPDISGIESNIPSLASAYGFSVKENFTAKDSVSTAVSGISGLIKNLEPTRGMNIDNLRDSDTIFSGFTKDSYDGITIKNFKGNENENLEPIFGLRMNDVKDHYTSFTNYGTEEDLKPVISLSIDDLKDTDRTFTDIPDKDLLKNTDPISAGIPDKDIEPVIGLADDNITEIDSVFTDFTDEEPDGITLDVLNSLVTPRNEDNLSIKNKTFVAGTGIGGLDIPNNLKNSDPNRINSKDDTVVTGIHTGKFDI